MKIDKIYSSSIDESKRSGLFKYSYLDTSNLINNAWIEQRAKFHAGLNSKVEILDGYGLHLTFGIKLNYTDRLKVFDDKRNEELISYQTIVGQEENRIYKLEYLPKELILLPILNGDTLRKVHLTKLTK
ncbi:MAG: hypothetical protein IPI30_22145 [Saprospiraceae bacterium]|nr:hypothetical protein [Candidatus Vicinibacter affinis]